MAKSKKNNKSLKKPSVKVQDLEPEKDPKGGAVDYFLKLGGIKGEAYNKVGALAHKFDTNVSLTDASTYKIKK